LDPPPGLPPLFYIPRFLFFGLLLCLVEEPNSGNFFNILRRSLKLRIFWSPSFSRFIPLVPLEFYRLALDASVSSALSFPKQKVPFDVSSFLFPGPHALARSGDIIEDPRLEIMALLPPFLFYGELYCRPLSSADCQPCILPPVNFVLSFPIPVIHYFFTLP